MDAIANLLEQDQILDAVSKLEDVRDKLEKELSMIPCTKHLIERLDTLAGSVYNKIQKKLLTKWEEFPLREKCTTASVTSMIRHLFFGTGLNPMLRKFSEHIYTHIRQCFVKHLFKTTENEREVVREYEIDDFLLFMGYLQDELLVILSEVKYVVDYIGETVDVDTINKYIVEHEKYTMAQKYQKRREKLIKTLDLFMYSNCNL